MRALITAAVAGTVLALAACGGGGQAGPVQTLPALPSAHDVASQLHVARFTDCGPAPMGGVADSGTGYLNGKRVGIDTFATTAARDSWKHTSSSFGVIPLEQGRTWVLYNAVSQAGTGCG